MGSFGKIVFLLSECARPGSAPVSGAQWSRMRAKFNCPHGVTNVWERSTVKGEERVKIAGDCEHKKQG